VHGQVLGSSAPAIHTVLGGATPHLLSGRTFQTAAKDQAHMFIALVMWNSM
jgi:hypothetical protein